MNIRKLWLIDIIDICKEIIPTLVFNSHKGQNGRIGILGGSIDYTGAPYYAGQSALKYGADLAYIFCAKEASIPIKSYSPELMVTPFYDSEVICSKIIDEKMKQAHVKDMVAIVTQSFSRIHSLVIGPGLGRDSYVLSATSQIISKAILSNIPLVIDADGLYLIAQDMKLIQGYDRCILTPNAVEFDRLLTAAIHEIDTQSLEQKCLSETTTMLKSNDIALQIYGLSKYLNGVTIIRKGEYDMICSGEDLYIIMEKGSPRRCGGQGDILAGILGVNLHWASQKFVDLKFQDTQENSRIYESLQNFLKSEDKYQFLDLSSSFASNAQRTEGTTNHQNYTVAAMLSSFMVKQSSAAAYLMKHRSMTSPDIIDQIGEVMYSLESSKAI